MIDGTQAREITPTFTKRMQIGFEDLDRVFGSSRKYDDQGEVTHEEFGLAVGQVYVCAGQSGVGKTTLYSLMAINLMEAQNKRIGIYQGEMQADRYMEMVLNIYASLGIKPVKLWENLFVFRESDHTKHCERVKDLKLDWMIWDSFSVLDLAVSAKGAKQIVLDIQNAVTGQCNAFIVTHLDEKGKLLGAGSKKLIQLCDSEYHLKHAPAGDWEHPEAGKGRIVLVSAKNRGGASNVSCYFRRFGQEIRLLKAYTPDTAPSRIENR